MARREKRIDELPAQRQAKPIPVRTCSWLVLRHEGRVLLERRPVSGLWGGLWTFPESRRSLGCEIGRVRRGVRFDHVFTHFRLRVQPLHCEVRRVLPQAAYDDYAARGEAENRNKELKCDLKIDRTSDHRFLANFFRLYLHAAAHNLLVRLRRAFAAPPPPPTSTSLDPASDPLPTEALDGRARRRFFNRRRQADPLGEGQPCTWRSLLIKVAAEVSVSTRRIVVRLSASWPYLDWYRRLADFVTSLHPVASG